MRTDLISKSINGNSSELKILKHLRERYNDKLTILAHCRTWNLFEPRKKVIDELINKLWPEEKRAIVIDFFDRTEWDFVVAKELENGQLIPLLIIDHDGLCN